MTTQINIYAKLVLMALVTPSLPWCEPVSCREGIRFLKLGIKESYFILQNCNWSIELGIVDTRQTLETAATTALSQ